jgi:hypothetical protein
MCIFLILVRRRLYGGMRMGMGFAGRGMRMGMGFEGRGNENDRYTMLCAGEWQTAEWRRRESERQNREWQNAEWQTTIAALISSRDS